MLKPALRFLAGIVLVVLPAGAAASTESSPGRNGIILFERTESPALFSIDTSSGRVRRLRGLRSGGGAAFSPDGLRIASVSGGVVISALNGRNRKRITVGGSSPTWSPDGSQLAFVRRKALFVIGADGHGLRRLVTRASTPDWSPDGTRIVYEANGEVYVLGVPGFRPVKIAERGPAGCDTWRWLTPRWDPSGKRIVSEVVGISCSSAKTGSTIVVMDADGSNETGLACCASYAPVWSPDGRFIAYADFDTGSLWVQEEASRREDPLLDELAMPLDWQPRCTLRGGPRRDVLHGRSGADLVCGLGGSDVIGGGRASDRLFGNDGNDRFFAQDGEFDVVGCGAGRDSVVADRGDLVGRDCERVTR